MDFFDLVKKLKEHGYSQEKALEQAAKQQERVDRLDREKRGRG